MQFSCKFRQLRLIPDRSDIIIQVLVYAILLAHQVPGFLIVKAFENSVSGIISEKIGYMNSPFLGEQLIPRANV
jgi:hypothetical protein